MAREKKAVIWGVPGQSGITDDGLQWVVPENAPTIRDRIMQKVLRMDGTYMPIGAQPIPARTAAEVRERCMLKYGEGVAKVLRPDEEIVGFMDFELNDYVPQPPRAEIEAKIGPNPLKHWWMGGDWDTMAGQFIRAVGSTRHGNGRRVLGWVRTNQRIAITGTMQYPTHVGTSFGLDQVGIRPGWQPGDPGKGLAGRVDVAFTDGSWIGLDSSEINVPGWTEGAPARDLLAELAGLPVTATVLPARGR